MIMKKPIKNVEHLIYKYDNVSLYRINNILHLYGENDYTINDIYEILLYGKKHFNDESFYNIKLNNDDKQNAKSINIIYHLTGGNKIWKNNNWIWKKDWAEMSIIFLEYFDDKIKNILESSKTIKELNNKINNKIILEDFYELGLMLDLIINTNLL